MLRFEELTISVDSLKITTVSPEVLQILKFVRPEWEAGNIRGKVCSLKTYTVLQFSVKDHSHTHI